MTKRIYILGALAILVVMAWLVITRNRQQAVIMSNVDSEPKRGATNPLVVIREFSDFECPACRAAEGPLRQLLEKYSQQIQLEYSDFPLSPSVHPRAYEAALAANCANDQGKFWEFHDVLLERQKEWSTAPDVSGKFRDYMQELEGDAARLQTCVTAQSFKGAVAADVARGKKIGINATPTFLVGEQRVVGGRSLSDWETLLAPYLSAVSAGPTR